MNAMTEDFKIKRKTLELVPLGVYMDRAAADVEAADAAITISDGWIEIRIAGLYSIEVSRITDCMCLFGWVLHLSNKPWFSALHARRFAKKVCAYKGWPVPRM